MTYPYVCTKKEQDAIALPFDKKRIKKPYLVNEFFRFFKLLLVVSAVCLASSFLAV